MSALRGLAVLLIFLGAGFAIVGLVLNSPAASVLGLGVMAVAAVFARITRGRD